ncbi:ABC transporter permease [Galactobacter valiniphilus]|uniref:ABC transporter permease n=1 Tax=Galactobacter valiniphilus TaxID=2676122 RepID=A0A399J774_9MICC|nr:ABC transporter permease [Galactobacter valiniphilus]RII41363.1 ABC transporter permease [Galactobacter valiniphilus]
MFLALRELFFARGRFALMGVVVGLISVLVVILSGLASGLVNDGVSGLKSLHVTSFAFNAGTMKDNAFSRSTVDAKQVSAWQGVDGVEQAEPMGVSIVNGTTQSDHQIDLTLFGVQPGGFLSPSAEAALSAGAPGDIVVSETAEQNGVKVGDTITLERSEVQLRVAGFTKDQATFGHVDVAYLPLETWRYLAGGETQAGAVTPERVNAASYELASVVAVKAAEGAAIDTAAADEAASTMTMAKKDSFNASPGYQAETMTLSMIQVFLYAICALVVGAFFTVWTIQRSKELAVLRAMGASTGFLLRDALAQSVIVMVVFTGLGVLVGLGLGALMPDAMPFSLEAGPVASATVLTIVLGLIGAAVSVLRVTRISPLRAFGGAR